MNENVVDILLVEDNPNDAELTIRELRKHKLANNLVHVHNGKDALDFIFGGDRNNTQHHILHKPSVILLDIQMPKVNGFEVLKVIKSDPRTRMLPVVVLTSSKEHPDIKACYDLGANSYIVKPVNFDRFIDAIKSFGFYWLLINQKPE